MVARPNLTTHCGRPKNDKTKGSKEEEASSCMMKYKTTDSNLGSQCAVHHRDVHRIELGVLFHLIQKEARHGPARVGRVMGKERKRDKGQMPIWRCKMTLHWVDVGFAVRSW